MKNKGKNSNKVGQCGNIGPHVSQQGHETQKTSAVQPNQLNKLSRAFAPDTSHATVVDYHPSTTKTPQSPPNQVNCVKRKVVNPLGSVTHMVHASSGTGDNNLPRDNARAHARDTYKSQSQTLESDDMDIEMRDTSNNQPTEDMNHQLEQPLSGRNLPLQNNSTNPRVHSPIEERQHMQRKSAPKFILMDGKLKNEPTVSKHNETCYELIIGRVKEPQNYDKDKILATELATILKDTSKYTIRGYRIGRYGTITVLIDKKQEDETLYVHSQVEVFHFPSAFEHGCVIYWPPYEKYYVMVKRIPKSIGVNCLKYELKQHNLNVVLIERYLTRNNEFMGTVKLQLGSREDMDKLLECGRWGPPVLGPAPPPPLHTGRAGHISPLPLPSRPAPPCPVRH